MADPRYRDFLYITLGVGALFGALFLYAGVWPPVVVVESNSMMHVDPQEYNGGKGATFAEDTGFGRVGTLDPGDLVILKSIEDRDDVRTFAETDQTHYGMEGDVIAYEAEIDGAPVTVIHRAITYVTIRGEGADTRYIVDWTDRWTEPRTARCATEPQHTCVFNATVGVSIPEMGMFNQRFARSGFLTKGDNEASNAGLDQAPPAPQQEALKPQPVSMDEVRGKAQGEIPGLGLLKLAFSGDQVINYEMQGHQYFLRIGNMVAPFDLWVLLAGELIVISIAPFLVAVGRDMWEGRRSERVEELSVLQAAWRDQQARKASIGERRRR